MLFIRKLLQMYGIESDPLHDWYGCFTDVRIRQRSAELSVRDRRLLDTMTYTVEPRNYLTSR